jgi:cell division protein FtsL
MAKKQRRVAPGRRSLVAMALIGFVIVTSIVIARRAVGVNQQEQIRKLNERRTALDAERIRLESEIRDASSRARLQPIAEQRLNMHIPTADQQVILTPPAPPSAQVKKP